LREALLYLNGFVTRPEAWPYQDIQGIAYADYLPLILEAERVYGKQPDSAAVQDALRKRLPAAYDWLQWPAAPTATEMAAHRP
jgi:hypothetical protein